MNSLITLILLAATFTTLSEARIGNYGVYKALFEKPFILAEGELVGYHVLNPKTGTFCGCDVASVKTLAEFVDCMDKEETAGTTCSDHVVVNDTVSYVLTKDVVDESAQTVKLPYLFKHNVTVDQLDVPTSEKCTMGEFSIDGHLLHDGIKWYSSSKTDGYHLKANLEPWVTTQFEGTQLQIKCVGGSKGVPSTDATRPTSVLYSYDNELAATTSAPTNAPTSATTGTTTTSTTIAHSKTSGGASTSTGTGGISSSSGTTETALTGTDYSRTLYDGGNLSVFAGQLISLMILVLAM